MESWPSLLEEKLKEVGGMQDTEPEPECCRKRSRLPLTGRGDCFLWGLGQD